MKKLVLFFLCFIFYYTIYSQSKPAFDVLSYHLNIRINDTTNRIQVVEDIEVIYQQKESYFRLNLADNQDNRGMTVSKVTINGQEVGFQHGDNQLILFTPAFLLGDTNWVQIRYSGIPKNGLIISENKFKSRTFFGDNWPNRAQHWMACVDHPSDKAKIQFDIKAPQHYTIIANGKKIYEQVDEQGIKMTSYQSDLLLPTKVMVFGAADFKVDTYTNDHGVEVSSWVYPQNEEAGFYDLRLAGPILDFYIQLFGAYPFEKLANVQSTTMFGGMENASCIFYDENAIDGKRSMEGLIAHEIVHQWFGNCASEKDWSDLWLSEGFATFFTSYYFEKKVGQEANQPRWIKDRNLVLSYVEKTKLPLKDTVTTKLMELLNANSYQKGAWVLHMLRHQLGDSIFMEGVLDYFNTFRFGNANTADFFHIMQTHTNQGLATFQHQWLRVGENPKLKCKSIIAGKSLKINVDQLTNYIFELPLEIMVHYEDGTKELKYVPIHTKSTQIKWTCDKKIKAVVWDPQVVLLAEMN